MKSSRKRRPAVTTAQLYKQFALSESESRNSHASNEESKQHNTDSADQDSAASASHKLNPQVAQCQLQPVSHQPSPPHKDDAQDEQSPPTNPCGEAPVPATTGVVSAGPVALERSDQVQIDTTAKATSNLKGKLHAKARSKANPVLKAEAKISSAASMPQAPSQTPEHLKSPATTQILEPQGSQQPQVALQASVNQRNGSAHDSLAKMNVASLQSELACHNNQAGAATAKDNGGSNLTNPGISSTPHEVNRHMLPKETGPSGSKFVDKKYQELVSKLSDDDPQQRHIKEQILNIHTNREALNKLDKLGEWYFDRQSRVAATLRQNLLAYIQSQEQTERAAPFNQAQFEQNGHPAEYSQHAPVSQCFNEFCPSVHEARLKQAQVVFDSREVELPSGYAVVFCTKCCQNFQENQYCDHCFQVYTQSDYIDGKDWVSCSLCEKWNHVCCEVNGHGDEDADMRELAVAEMEQTQSRGEYWCLKCRNLPEIKARRDRLKSRSANKKKRVAATK